MDASQQQQSQQQPHHHQRQRQQQQPLPPTPPLSTPHLAWQSPLVKLEEHDEPLVDFPSHMSPVEPLPSPTRSHVQHAASTSPKRQKTAASQRRQPTDGSPGPGTALAGAGLGLLGDGYPQRQIRAAAPLGVRGLHAKSSYRNMLDGTAPGFFSPKEFTTRAQSKRTAHKLSEKARRDRLTAAIREMHDLLPEGLCREMQEQHISNSHGSGSGSGNGHDVDASNVPISKAIVVESAIRYIRQLKSDMTRRRGEEAKAEEWG